MLRKIWFLICVIAILSLSGGGLASAQSGYLQWEKVFDPKETMDYGHYEDGDIVLWVNSVEEFKNELFITVGAVEGGGQVWHSPDGKNWQPAAERGFGFGLISNDCGENYYTTSWDMVTFKNKLYVMPQDWNYCLPGQVLRTADGVNWENVTQADFFSEGTAYPGQFIKMTVFNGMIYIAEDYNLLDIRIWRSTSGDAGTWQSAGQFSGWGWPGTMFAFKGALYIASDSVYSDDFTPMPSQIWRSYDGVTWEEVVSDGFGSEASYGLGSFAEKNGYLYVGVGTSDGVHGGQIFRTQDGKHWEPVELFGFGNPLNEKFDGIVTYKNMLYAYSLNWTEGCQVYASKDGLNWAQVNESGWGDSTNWTSHLGADQVVFKDELYLGVFGQFGGLMKLLHPQK
jgi:hypothetical protein